MNTGTAMASQTFSPIFDRGAVLSTPDTSSQVQLNTMASQKLERQKCEVYSRVVGYLSPVHRWNNGKKSEWTDRKTFDKMLCK